MSGPKVDTAALCEQDRQRLMRARQQRMELVCSISQMMEQIQSSFVPMENDAEDFASFSSAVQQRQREYLALLEEKKEQVRKGNESVDCALLHQSCEELFAAFKQKTAADIAAITLGREQRKIEVQGMPNAASRLPLIDGGLHAKATRRTKEQLRECFGAFLSDPTIKGRYKNAVLDLLDSLEKMQEADEDNPKTAKCIAELWSYFVTIQKMALEEQESMRQLYTLYCNECFDGTQEPLPLSAFSSEAELKKAIEALQLRAEQKISKEYIKRQIDDVMAKHGYDILRSELLEETRDDQILYGVNDHTAIHVFVSDEQQVAMRVVGIGFDEEITAEEDERLYEQQCAFCSLHPQITQELALRGVMLTIKKHLAPDKKYNKKIKVAATSSESRAKREMKRAAPKVLHRE